MDKMEKTKLRVLIKSILVYKSPNCLSANQLANIINEYDWGFRTSITSRKIGKFLSYELKNTHFLNNIHSIEKGGVLVYYYSLNNSK